ncbi:thermonuclease family protein [Nitrosomonas sp. Nm132]|uniref:thermonuclease family protein n=1 Tax=Nitrosomonas sp. Nm132 TaxID=1881053 RepID=UPI00087FD79C|nr:thermonuclease family protein [Nitrosomonas sp. Nm132]SDH25794.1 micrococcal nuclease [Nitrosomonas sp. Nm132]
MQPKIILFNLILLVLSLPLYAAQEYRGRVVAISDGDTLTILDSNKRQIKVRLAEIDTPESKQPYGSKAKQELSALAYNKTAIIKAQSTDRYKRVVGRVYVGNVDVNAELVRRGSAWVYRQYAKDKKLFLLEDQARKKRVGLWSLPESEKIPPWEWRRFKRR